MIESLLPASATNLERTIEQVLAVNEAEIYFDVRQLWNPNTCPEYLLPWLAWTFSVDNWNSNWPVNIKRAAIKSSVEIHRRKGTKKSVANVVATYGGIVSLVEWFEKTPKATPHTFDLFVTMSGNDGGELTAQMQTDLVNAVSETKPARSQFALTLGLNAWADVFISGVARPLTYRRMQFLGD